MAGPFPRKHFPPSTIILSQPGRIIKKETVYPQIAQLRAAATKEFYRDTDTHGSFLKKKTETGRLSQGKV